MTAQELRIGNYVNSINHNGFYEWEISAFYEVVTGQSSIDDFKPIPLTEEWLLKFGFEIVGKKTFYNNNIPVIPIYKIEKRQMYSCKGVGLDYVHQLQNLYFALTGEELTFKKIPNE